MARPALSIHGPKKNPGKYILLHNVFSVHIVSLGPYTLAMKRLLSVLLAVAATSFAHAQLLTWSPQFPKESDPAQTLVITVDASKGNRGLFNYTPTGDVYVHIGAITNLSASANDWKYVPFTWGTTVPAANATYLGNNKWSFTITGSLRTYFGITNAAETIQKVAILFRTGDGARKQTNSDGSDMYVPVYGSDLAARIFNPAREPRFNPAPEPQGWVVGTNFTVNAASSKNATLTLYHNGSIIATASNTQSITGYSVVTANGNQQLILMANDGLVTRYDTVNIFAAPSTSPVAALPAGVRDGINYQPGDTSVILVLHAPGKNIATVIGEFNNWTQDTPYIMRKTPDGKKFWLRVRGLSPGVEYAYQYRVDDSIKIADPYATKVLDPFNDGFITAATYPNLKPYPSGQTGIVSVLQTARPAYSWAVNNFSRPDKRGLVIYELLLRDFISAHDWKTLRDTLGYLKKLGINAIELMPVNEFEGNISWGYNPNYYFAPDKYYGNETSLKQFIDSCHSKGIAVILDIALNHQFGSSPLVQLYYDGANNRPAPNNPWFNPVAKHAYNVGYDMNHESAETKYFTSRVIEHWTTQYKVDGFRFDLSKGFTQKQTCDNNGNNCDEGAMAAYDTSRVRIWKGYYDTLQLKAPGSYAILEHFAAPTEDKELAEYGMLLWGNHNFNYAEASMGYLAQSNFEGIIHSVRGWTKPHLVGYMESHDEERIVYKNINFGNSAGAYNIRDTTTALKRMELNAAFFLTIPGPKMIWQFGELGYPYSINTCTNGTVNNACRLDPKPITWNYLADPRRVSVYNTYSKLNALRFHPSYRDAFIAGTVERNLAGGFKWLKVSADTSNLVVIGNFDVTTQTGQVTFQSAGTWYDLFSNTTITATGGAQSFTLAPGAFHVYTNRIVANLNTTAITQVPVSGNRMAARIYPNPVAATFTLDIYIPQAGTTSFRIVNAAGQQVGDVQQQFLLKGRQQKVFSRSGLPGGVYYMQVTSKGQQTILPLLMQ